MKSFLKSRKFQFVLGFSLLVIGVGGSILYMRDKTATELTAQCHAKVEDLAKFDVEISSTDFVLASEASELLQKEATFRLALRAFSDIVHYAILEEAGYIPRKDSLVDLTSDEISTAVLNWMLRQPVASEFEGMDQLIKQVNRVIDDAFFMNRLHSVFAVPESTFSKLSQAVFPQIVAIYGDSKFQNGFGAWSKTMYMCSISSTAREMTTIVDEDKARDLKAFAELRRFHDDLRQKLLVERLLSRPEFQEIIHREISSLADREIAYDEYIAKKIEQERNDEKLREANERSEEYIAEVQRQLAERKLQEERDRAEERQRTELEEKRQGWKSYATSRLQHAETTDRKVLSSKDFQATDGDEHCYYNGFSHSYCSVRKKIKKACLSPIVVQISCLNQYATALGIRDGAEETCRAYEEDCVKFNVLDVSRSQAPSLR